MIRCFFNINYIGTQFRGAQRIWGLKIFEDPTTIEGNLELAFHDSPYRLTSPFQLSSRTDSGVHALNNTAHVDLVSKNGKRVYCDQILYFINKYFLKNALAINIKQARRVHPEFNCRKYAKSRTYLYRLAIRRCDKDKVFLLQSANVEEWRRSWLFAHPDWDVDKFREGASLLIGRHDFETFRKVSKVAEYQENIRTIHSITIERTKPLCVYPLQNLEDIEYYDIVIKGKSFIHNQIRRMVTALNSVAIGKLSLRDLQIMIQVPSKYSWPSILHVAPPYGLYLCEVEYDPSDLVFLEDEEDIIEKPLVSVRN